MTLSHSPADVIRYLLIDLFIGEDPEGATVGTGSGEDWPIYVSNTPDYPDECLTVYDTTGLVDGRSQIDGEVFEYRGIMVRIRAATYPVGSAKAEEVADCIDRSIYRETVVVDGSTYLVQSVSRRGTINYLGREPGTDRNLFTINAVVSLQQTS